MIQSKKLKFQTGPSTVEVDREIHEQSNGSYQLISHPQAPKRERKNVMVVRN